MGEFKDIYEKYAKNVYLFLMALTGGCADEAEELLAETFYQAFLHIDSFEGRSSLYTWLCQISKNAWLKECRRKQKFDAQDISEIEIRDTAPSPENQAIAREGHDHIMQAVYSLKEPYQDVFLLHVFGGVKLKDIAASYIKTEEWARVTYYRAKNKIAKQLQKRGGYYENSM